MTFSQMQSTVGKNIKRASVGTYIAQDGSVKTAPVNVARVDWSTGAPLLLIESAATNLCPNSTGDGVPWGGTSVTLNAVSAPDGSSAGGKAYNGGSGNDGITSTNYLNPQAGTYTISVWLRGDVEQAIDFYGIWNDSTGTQQVAQRPATITPQWQRFVVSGLNIAAAAQSVYWQINLAPGQTVYFWGTQIEAGGAATSYIPTNGAAASRAADFLY